MRPVKIRVPQNLIEILEILSSMLVSAPRFLDKTGYFPYMNLEYAFQQLNQGFSHNRLTLGEKRYADLMRMSDQMRALFEADPEDKTGETLKGCKVIQEMEEMLRQVQQES